MDTPVLTKYRYFYIILEKGILPYWRQGIYDQLLSGIRDSLSNIFNFWNKSANSWTCQLYYYAFASLKLAKFKIDQFLWGILTMAHWIRLSLLCRCKWTRKSQVSGKNVSEQYLLSSALRAIPPPCLFVGFIFWDCLHFWIVLAMEFSRFWEAKVVNFGHFGSPGALFRGSGPHFDDFWVCCDFGSVRERKNHRILRQKPYH